MLPYKPKNKIRIVTTTSLFDGHDAAINIMRRILQSTGCEVIHLGHNRSVSEVVNCAIQEDAQAIALTSYQGGHLEYMKYMYDLLKEKGAGHIKIFGGGGGVIHPHEIEELHKYGIARIYSPDDGRAMGLQGMINHLLENCDFSTGKTLNGELLDLKKKNPGTIASAITYFENFPSTSEQVLKFNTHHPVTRTIPVIGITGTGGSGKSSLTDEIVRRLLLDFTDKTIAILSVDPTKRKTGGALLGDRIRMNAIDTDRVYMRSLATRQSNLALSKHINEALMVCKAAGFDFIFIETSGIGQSDSEISEYANVCVYVMTSEYGAASQLEKIDMLDFADCIVINKSDKKGSLDALRDVRKQYKRNHNLFEVKDENLPVYSTIASQYNDPGTNYFYHALIEKIKEKTKINIKSKVVLPVNHDHNTFIIPPERTRYLVEIAETHYKEEELINQQTKIADLLYRLSGTLEFLEKRKEKEELTVLKNEYDKIWNTLDPFCKELINNWEKNKEVYKADTFNYMVRDKIIKQDLYSESLSHLKIPKICLPEYKSWGDILRWQLRENLPGVYPYTAGVFPLKRQNEDPARMFAGEGGPERTNKRFHYVSISQPAKRLSTAFDSVTLYGEDPDHRPDIYGKIGNSGVSIATLDDAKKLYSGFNLCDPSVSVSMTINGPAPIILGYFMNAAIDQQCEIYIRENNLVEQTYKKILEIYKNNTDKIPFYQIEDVELEEVKEEIDDLKLMEGIELQEIEDFYGSEYKGELTDFHLQFFDSKNEYAFLIKYKSNVAGYYIVKEIAKKKIQRCELFILKKYRKFRVADKAIALIGRFFFKKGIDEIINICSSKNLSTIRFLERHHFKLVNTFRISNMEMSRYSTKIYDNLNALPQGNNGLGLLLLGLTGDQVLPEEIYQKIKSKTLSHVRGTVQADILKEDQAQNTCIFSTEFALKMMGDIQQFFIQNNVRNFYSVSISGYHIAEAGANPISQLAFTLSNGFTFVEYYLSRGMNIDDLAPNLSFFFSNGIDPEYAVIGRVARRIWARAIKNLYKGNERSQKLKYHIQTSGRSLHAQEIAFNDIRTTLQALYAIYDNCNSLHTNAYDEAITTPTEESVRRAMAIQHIINKELGLAKNENPLQGSFIIEKLTDMVEEAVIQEFKRISERGGVLGAMETMYQRGKIQEESLYYETMKHSGEYPVVGVNTFLDSKGSPTIIPSEVIRSTTTEKEFAIQTLNNYKFINRNLSSSALNALQKIAIESHNIFDQLMETCKVCTLGQITHSLYEVGGQYRRNM